MNRIKKDINKIKRPTTIRDVAEKANVSISTVSRVMNNNPRISDKTKKRILEIVVPYQVYKHQWHKNMDYSIHGRFIGLEVYIFFEKGE